MVGDLSLGVTLNKLLRFRCLRLTWILFKKHPKPNLLYGLKETKEQLIYCLDPWADTFLLFCKTDIQPVFSSVYCSESHLLLPLILLF